MGDAGIGLAPFLGSVRRGTHQPTSRSPSFHDIRGYEVRKSLQPKASRFGFAMTELPRLNDLVRFPVDGGHDAHRIFNRYPRTIRIDALHEEVNAPLLPSVLPLFGEPSRSGYRQVGARRMGDDEIPMSGDVDHLSGLRGEGAITIQQRKAIAHNVPFGMSAGAVLKVGGVGFVSLFAECLANRLGLLASYEYFQVSFSLRMRILHNVVMVC